MHISDFDYDLPEELIAQHPVEKRDASRMLIVDRLKNSWRDSHFSELPSILKAGDLLVINNTRVFPARLVGTRKLSGGKVELFLISQHKPLVWEVLARPARRLGIGEQISFGDGKRLSAKIVAILAEGKRLVEFQCDEDFEVIIDELGQVPLPPYIKRKLDENFIKDKDRYQTIYARKRGAIAAPTAGLHFTPNILNQLRSNKVEITEITLHVGYATFEPVRVDNIEEHHVSAEHYEITSETAEKINHTKSLNNRVIAVGTTTTRALESAVNNSGQIEPGKGLTNLTILPGHKFKIVDELITNFHLPRSSLLMLVAAFAGYDLTLSAYRHAVKEKYRFYSYGDCTLII